MTNHYNCFTDLQSSQPLNDWDKGGSLVIIQQGSKLALGCCLWTSPSYCFFLLLLTSEVDQPIIIGLMVLLWIILITDNELGSKALFSGILGKHTHTYYIELEPAINQYVKHFNNPDKVRYHRFSLPHQFVIPSNKIVQFEKHERIMERTDSFFATQIHRNTIHT